MKYIPQALINKLNEKWQVEAKDAQPHLRLVATQATVNTLISEPIHEDISSAYGDVAIRQLPGEKTPSRAYAVCIDNGIVKIYERHFPADLDNPWRYVWTLGEAKDVAIEFNGNWVLDAKNRWYILKTEETPYLFWIGTDDILYAQKWDDEGTRIILDTGVLQISVCKGWHSTLMSGLDQGLIVGYIKDGKVYYRAFCYQTTGEQIWEPSYEVTELGTGNNTLSVFRTNDFRIGIACENAGQMKWTLSHRNYAGMSFRPETANAQVQNVVCFMEKTKDIFLQGGRTDYAAANIEGLWFLQYPTTAPTLAVTKKEKIYVDEKTASGFKLFLNLPISSVPDDYTSKISIIPSMTVTGVSYDEALEALIISVSPNFLRSIDVTISIKESRGAYYFKYPGQKHPLEVLSGFVAREINNIYGYAKNETISATIDNPRVILVNSMFTKLVEQETVAATIQGVTATLTAVASLPI